MAVDVQALDQADPGLLGSTSDELVAAVLRLRAVELGLLGAVQRTVGGWTGSGHDAWSRKVSDLAGRVGAAADALDDLGGATATVARAATDGQAQLQAAAATAALFGQSVGLPEVEWATIRLHYEALLLDAGEVFDALAQRAPAAPAVPLVCPPPPPAPARPWWDDLLFGDLPPQLDAHCQPVEYQENGVVSPSMLRWVRALGRADKLDEPLDVLRHRIVASKGFQHTSKHAGQWFGRTPNKAMLDEWADLLADASRSKQVYNSAIGAGDGRVQTMAQLYTKGDKHLILHFLVKGEAKGELTTAVVASQRQLSEAYRLLRYHR